MSVAIFHRDNWGYHLGPSGLEPKPSAKGHPRIPLMDVALCRTALNTTASQPLKKMIFSLTHREVQRGASSTKFLFENLIVLSVV
jgi:hypothetical protein